MERGAADPTVPGSAKGSSWNLLSAFTVSLTVPAPSSWGLRRYCPHPVTDRRSYRTHWNRIFPVALFVEHVLLGIESQIPELRELVTEHVFLLNKVSAGLGSQRTRLFPGRGSSRHPLP